MSKHTPGPWYVVGGDSTEDTAISTKPEGNHYNSEVLGYSEWLRVEDVDLTLMAAAPEMLDVLLEIEKFMGADFHDLPMAKRALSAIAKATGEKK
jgi:hypothetical protein